MNNLEYVDINFDPLNKDKVELFKSFKNLIKENTEQEKVLLLYRGTMYSNIEERLSHSNLNKNSIFKRAFYFGEKARFCSDESINKHKKMIFNDINDCTLNTFESIFDEIELTLSLTKLEKLLSKKFKKYFSNRENKKIFVSSLDKLEYEQKLLIRDYYLYLLHTGYTIKYDTPLVSTSIKRSIAKTFSKKQKTDERIIFHYFVPQPFECFIIAPWKISAVIDLITEKNLPEYEPLGLFPKQKEISAKGGLFPQFILGIEMLDKKKFIVNPYLFEYQFSDLDNLIKYGIQFDQSNFTEDIKETKHSDSIHIDVNGCISSVKLKV